VDWGLIPEAWHLGFDAQGRGYLTDPHSYRVDVFENGEMVRTIRRSHSPRRLTTQDVEAIQAAGLHTIDTMSTIAEADRSNSRREFADYLAGKTTLPIPDHVPPLGEILVSPDGGFWVERVDEGPLPEFALSATFGFWGRVPEYGSTWDLYDRNGIFLGAIRLPRRFRPEAVDGLEVVGVFADDLDIEYAVKYRAVAAPR
jgi:hypothetical protein